MAHGGGAAAPIAVPHAPGAAGPAAEGEGDAPAPEPAVVPCEVCAAGAAKYKCPRCFVQTCSLACVKRHKAEQECSGVRNKAEYRSLTDFTDNDMRSDFHFLTDVERVADTAHREAYKAKLMLRPQLPNHLKNLVRQASFRAVALQIMPATLQRRKDNTTFFNHKTKDMLWRIELVFHMDSGAVVARDKVSEKTPLKQVVPLPRPPSPARGTRGQCQHAPPRLLTAPGKRRAYARWRACRCWAN